MPEDDVPVAVKGKPNFTALAKEVETLEAQVPRFGDDRDNVVPYAFHVLEGMLEVADLLKRNPFVLYELTKLFEPPRNRIRLLYGNHAAAVVQCADAAREVAYILQEEKMDAKLITRLEEIHRQLSAWAAQLTPPFRVPEPCNVGLIVPKVQPPKRFGGVLRRLFPKTLRSMHP